VVVQGFLPQVDAPSIDIDNRAGARKAVEFLIGLGHRRIAYISNAPLAYTSAAERLEGYRDALEGAGIPYDADLVIEGAFDPASGHAAMETLMRRATGCQAVFVASDVVALGAIGALRSAGLRIPRDVSVVGFDDIPLAAHFDPPLTTVRLPAYDLGHAAGQALVDRVAGRPVPSRTLLPTELIVRSSTAPPAAGATNAPAVQR
jgi:DNA-binding LacI/PurR family transcriptional regulator